jgi:hypothetical protein
MSSEIYGVGGFTSVAPGVLQSNNAPPTRFKGKLGQFFYNRSVSTPQLSIYDGSSWVSTAFNAGFPITPYVVGNSTTSAGYQSIQSALDAANVAGGGMIFVQRGTYVENLTFYNNIQLFGDSEQGTFIVGTHTPPSSGTLNVFRCTLQGTNAIFSSNAAGTTSIIVEDCTLNVTNGYSFDLPNWTSAGSIAVDDIGPFGTNDGFIRNIGATGFFAFGAGIGDGTANPMILSGITEILGCSIGCPIQFQTGSVFTIDNSFTNAGITCSNNSTGAISNSRISSGAAAAITMSSSGSIKVSNTIIDSSNNPAIAGSGAGTLSYQDLAFLSNALFAGTLTLSGSSLTGTVNTSLSSGTLSVKSTTANPGDNAGFLQCSINGSVAYIPYFTNIAP